MSDSRPSFDPVSTRAMIADIEFHLFEHFLLRWFPACVDPMGGFHQSFARDWTALPDTSKGVVFQSRMTWTAATVAEAYPDRPQFREWADHGKRILLDAHWDRKNGGFVWQVAADLGPFGAEGPFKRTYGQAFAVFALSAVARTLDDAEARESAERGFEWLEKHAHDAENGGWIEVLQPDGSKLSGDNPDLKEFGSVARYGVKLQNTHLHMIEALLELCKTSASVRVRERLRQAATIMMERMFVEPGCMQSVFHPDWTPLPAAWSIGHDLEASLLLRDAASVVELPGIGEITERLIAHALDRGFDWERGGVFEAADAIGWIWDRSKGWWNQFEALGAFAAALESCSTPDPRLAEAFEKQWNWIRNHQFDPEFGGVFDKVAENGKPVGNAHKGHGWKASYHETRAMLRSLRFLKSRDSACPEEPQEAPATG